ncbi:putative Serine-threonine-protein [Naja naja]|nr:putative Serine-threonine-protein [Naja naja]
MAFRRVVTVSAAAACGLAGGSVLFSAVALGKQHSPPSQQGEEKAGGDAPETLAASLTGPPPPPPGLLLLPSPTASGAPAWLEKANGCGYWDNNWDRREPLALMNLKKKNEETGREQAELTGMRLASLGLKFDKIVHSSMARATETTNIISKHLPGVTKLSTDLLREGAPIEPNPPSSHWKPEAVYYEDGARIEAAFRNYIHRADIKQEMDSYEIFVCHANVIRYIVCR